MRSTPHDSTGALRMEARGAAPVKAISAQSRRVGATLASPNRELEGPSQEVWRLLWMPALCRAVSAGDSCRGPAEDLVKSDAEPKDRHAVAEQSRARSLAD